MTPESKRKKTGTGRKKRERIAYLNAKHLDFLIGNSMAPCDFSAAGPGGIIPF